MADPFAADSEPLFQLKDVCVRIPRQSLIRGISMDIRKQRVLTLMGPSGAGKSMLLKCLNRFHELSGGVRTQGEILFHGESIFNPRRDVDEHRRKVGMLFQQPVVFPKSIAQNVLFGAKKVLSLSKAEEESVLERCLKQVHLWKEVKDRLNQPAFTLSIGQQQRLCLARTLAVEPEVILMDEPTSALDEKTTRAINELIQELKSACTLVLVSHDRAQALEVSDEIAWIEAEECVGELLFHGSKDEFESFEDQRQGILT